MKSTDISRDTKVLIRDFRKIFYIFALVILDTEDIVVAAEDRKMIKLLMPVIRLSSFEGPARISESNQWTQLTVQQNQVKPF